MEVAQTRSSLCFGKVGMSENGENNRNPSLRRYSKVISPETLGRALSFVSWPVHPSICPLDILRVSLSCAALRALCRYPLVYSRLLMPFPSLLPSLSQRLRPSNDLH